MSEAAKVRLVRCPKCENLLPELNDYSLYQCGNCDAVLRAKRNASDVEALSEKSDAERRVLGEVSETSSEKSVGMTSRITRLDNNVNSNGRYENYVTGLSAKDYVDVRPQEDNAVGLQWSGEVQDWTNRERNEMGASRPPQRSDVLNTRHSASNYLEEGKSKHSVQSIYGFEDSVEKRYQNNGFDDAVYLVDDRAELLRKLDELRDQISRTCDLAEKSKDRVLLRRRMVPHDSYYRSEIGLAAGPSAVNGSSMPYSFPEKRIARVPYIDHYAGRFPLGDGDELFPATYNSRHLGNCEHCSRPQQLSGDLHQPYAPFEHKLCDKHFSSLYANRNLVHTDSYESYPPNMTHHHAFCSCFHCNSNNKVPINAYGDRWSLQRDTVDQASYHERSIHELQSQYSSAKASVLPSFQFHHSESHSERTSVVSGSHPAFIRTVNSGHLCQPIAGGAPFLICQNCFELLLLPKKVFIRSENQKKVKCGACSATIEVVVDKNRPGSSVHAEGNANHQKDDSSPSKHFTERHPGTLGHSSRAKTSFSSEDTDIFCSDFQPSGRELGSRSTGQVSSSKSSEVRNVHSTYSSSSDEVENIQTSPAREKESNNTEMRVKGSMPPPPAGSSLQEYFDYSDKFKVMPRIGNGKGSGHSELDKSPRENGLSRQNSTKDASQVEIDIQCNEYSNTGTSLDSCEASKEGANKVPESYVAGMKNSFGDLNKSKNDISQEKANVTINGNLIPDRLIKKAEKLAGPIYPGHYWYDFRAGFWGVMGGPCLGIIPSFIEEFNYPMPESCTGGKTGVLVNGRELHEKDLNLLAIRGLPTERDKSYIVEISGRVLNEDTGEELKSLGKLAPTVEKLKHGFGMKDRTKQQPS